MTGILCAAAMIGAPTDASSGAPVDFDVDLSASSVSKSGTTSSLTTNSVTATPEGGTAPYSYDWSRVSGDRSISPTSDHSATTAFQRNSTSAGTAYRATWRCSVTDANGNVAISSNVTVTITRTDSAPGGGGGGGGGAGGGTFLGLDSVSLQDDTIGTSSVTYSVNSNGTSSGGNWNSSASVGSSYEVKAVVASGQTPTGTIGSWLSLSSNRSWTLTDGTVNNVPANSTLTVSIRQAGSTTTLDTATITLQANSLNSFG